MCHSRALCSSYLSRPFKVKKSVRASGRKERNVLSKLRRWHQTFTPMTVTVYTFSAGRQIVAFFGNAISFYIGIVNLWLSLFHWWFSYPFPSTYLVKRFRRSDQQFRCQSNLDSCWNVHTEIKIHHFPKRSTNDRSLWSLRFRLANCRFACRRMHIIFWKCIKTPTNVKPITPKYGCWQCNFSSLCLTEIR